MGRECLMKRMLVTCQTEHDEWRGSPGLRGYLPYLNLGEAEL